MIQEHWDKVFSTKTDGEMSWTQAFPKTALEYLKSLNLPKDAGLIDVGGGSGNFVDELLNLGYSDITVLDVSEVALAKSKVRLGDKGLKVNWVVSDILNFVAEEPLDFWYDRAVFHFLTKPEQIQKYVSIVNKSINPGGHLFLGAFSDSGPTKCSGLEITQYTESEMKNTFKDGFQTLECFTQIHTTPFETNQEFQFCGFVKL